MKQTYRALAGLIALGVLVQAASVAFGWFDVLNQVDEGALVFNSTDQYNVGHDIHQIVGMNVMPLLGLILLIVSFFAKIPSGVKWAAGLFVAIILQVVLGIVAFSVPIVGALHGINALVILMLASQVARRAATAGRTDAEPKQHAAV